jgi:hypothetical protein
MIPQNPFQLPQPTTPILGNSGQASLIFYNFLKSLFQRTGGQSGIPFTVGSALIASGASLANGLQLTNDYNEVLTGSGGVVLSALQPGQSQIVFNGLGGSLNVYPATASGQINALGNGTAFSLGNGKTQWFWCVKLQTNGGQFYRTVTWG